MVKEERVLFLIRNRPPPIQDVTYRTYSSLLETNNKHVFDFTVIWPKDRGPLTFRLKKSFQKIDKYNYNKIKKIKK